MGAICLRLQWVLGDWRALDQDRRYIPETCPRSDEGCEMPGEVL